MVTVLFILKPDRLEAYPTSLSSVVLIYAPNCPALPYDKASRGASQPANRTPTRVPASRGMFLAWQLATHRPAELLAGDRGCFYQGGRRGEGDGGGVRCCWCGAGARQRASLPDFVVDYFVVGVIGQRYFAFVHLKSQCDLGRSLSKHI